MNELQIKRITDIINRDVQNRFDRDYIITILEVERDKLNYRKAWMRKYVQDKKVKPEPESPTE